MLFPLLTFASSSFTRSSASALSSESVLLARPSSDFGATRRICGSGLGSADGLGSALSTACGDPVEDPAAAGGAAGSSPPERVR